MPEQILTEDRSAAQRWLASAPKSIGHPTEQLDLKIRTAKRARRPGVADRLRGQRPAKPDRASSEGGGFGPSVRHSSPGPAQRRSLKILPRRGRGRNGEAGPTITGGQPLLSLARQDAGKTIAELRRLSHIVQGLSTDRFSAYLARATPADRRTVLDLNAAAQQRGLQRAERPAASSDDPRAAREVRQAERARERRALAKAGRVQPTTTAFDGDRVMAVFIGDSKNTSAVKAALQINYVTKHL
jgi:hypothetical protein